MHLHMVQQPCALQVFTGNGVVFRAHFIGIDFAAGRNRPRQRNRERAAACARFDHMTACPQAQTMDQIGRIFGIDDLGVALDAGHEIGERRLHQQHRVTDLAIDRGSQGLPNQIRVFQVAEIGVKPATGVQFNQVTFPGIGDQNHQLPGNCDGRSAGNPGIGMGRGVAHRFSLLRIDGGCLMAALYPSRGERPSQRCLNGIARMESGG